MINYTDTEILDWMISTNAYFMISGVDPRISWKTGLTRCSILGKAGTQPRELIMEAMNTKNVSDIADKHNKTMVKRGK